LTASRYTPEQRAAMDAERTAFSRDVLDETIKGILAAVEAQAAELRKSGRWDDLQQLRLDGLRDILNEAEDFGLGFIAETCHAFGLRPDFELAERKDTPCQEGRSHGGAGRNPPRKAMGSALTLD